MDVRPALPGDVARIAEVHVLSWQDGYRGLLPQSLLDGLNPEWRVPRWAATVEQSEWPRRGILVVEHAGEVVGFADLRPTRDTDQDPDEVGEISSFYVSPSLWGHGAGRLLMASAVTTLGAAFTSAALWVLDGNVRAQRFYARNGWEPDGSIKNDVMSGAPIRDLRYRRNLNDRTSPSGG